MVLLVDAAARSRYTLSLKNIAIVVFFYRYTLIKSQKVFRPCWDPL